MPGGPMLGIALNAMVDGDIVLMRRALLFSSPRCDNIIPWINEK